jgi:excisionase family DNA binding protein
MELGMSRTERSTEGIRRLIGTKEVAEYLGISTRHLWTITNSGQIPSIRMGKSVRYDPVDIDAYIERCRSDRKGN